MQLSLCENPEIPNRRPTNISNIKKKKKLKKIKMWHVLSEVVQNVLKGW